ncbi:hypothetical protein BX661DRAFT_175087 [Kickxella alabastrina]|uniref:uncharacterized protein n=1 Tax=Kickxella alabastrina TaxID=61397 RepID=UPI00221EA4CF|nr:uncharacterized protein BX661DRAFT_175087 [Kickxella alabastrina]KAI7834567.1 hypothetical protein BX661DRAFT_175087 [Kickxella alabastrina]
MNRLIQGNRIYKVLSRPLLIIFFTCTQSQGRPMCDFVQIKSKKCYFLNSSIFSTCLLLSSGSRTKDQSAESA